MNICPKIFLPFPFLFTVLKSNMPFYLIKMGNRTRTIGVFGAIYASSKTKIEIYDSIVYINNREINIHPLICDPIYFHFNHKGNISNKNNYYFYSVFSFSVVFSFSSEVSVFLTLCCFFLQSLHKALTDFNKRKPNTIKNPYLR